jgi:hypothetical protein
MKSPFPGMDPYLETRGLWEGFHGHLIEAIYQAMVTAGPTASLHQEGQQPILIPTVRA